MKQHYYLLSTQVVYTKDKLERSRNFNILMLSSEPHVTRAQLGRAQQQAQVRFFTEFDTEQKSQVTDVFVMAVNYLGHMEESEFHAGFDLPSQQEEENTGASVESNLVNDNDPAPTTSEGDTKA